MNGVVPIGPVDSTHGNPNPSQFLYELAPAHDLPHLDFSVSICSWFVDRSWQPILTSFTRRRKALIACNIVGVVFNMVVITGNARTGRAVAPLVLLLQSPLPLSGILLLRYNMVRQLLRTYDVWFLFLTVTSSVIVLMIQLSDIRIVVIFSVWLSLMPNVFIDANSSGGRRVTIAHVVGLLATSLFLVIERLRGIDGIHNFTLFYYRRHQLSADAFVFNGFATIVAMLLRNLVRSRAKENRRHGVDQLRCVSYRCDLCLLPQAEARRRTRTILTTIPSINASSPSEMAKIAHRLQPLRLVKESAANVFLFSVRLLHRAWIFKGDELVILDGPVMYENSFAEAIS